MNALEIGGVAILGLCVGSFLNVVICRLPRMLESAVTQPDASHGESLSYPASHCPKCNTPLKIWHKIPLLSFFLLGQRCFFCKTPISWQYPVVELLTALIFLALWLSFPPAVAISYMVMAAIFLAGCFIDWQFKIIPDSLTVGGAFLGLLADAVSGRT